jgi:hypothetical protein
VRQRWSSFRQGNLYYEANDRAEVQVCGISLVNKPDTFMPGPTDFPLEAIGLGDHTQAAIGKLPSGMGGSPTGSCLGNVLSSILVENSSDAPLD